MTRVLVRGSTVLTVGPGDPPRPTDALVEDDTVVADLSADAEVIDAAFLLSHLGSAA